MKKTKIFLILFICCLVQTILPVYVKQYEFVKVQFVLIAVVYLCLERSWFAGLMVGITAGLLMDVFSGGERLGIYMLSYGIVGFLVSYYQEKLFEKNLSTTLLFVFAGSIFAPTINFNCLKLYNIELSYFYNFKVFILPIAAANIIVAALFYMIFKRFYRDRAKA